MRKGRLAGWCLWVLGGILSGVEIALGILGIGVFVLAAPAYSESDLIISGVIDGPLLGGKPKAASLYALNDIPDLSIYGIGSANNGDGSDGQEFTFPAVNVSSGDFIYITTDTGGFNSFFGFAPDHTDLMATNINGDDAIELFKNGTVMDVFGDINTDGTGEAWEHTDGWAYRKNGTGPDGDSFNLSNWTFSGPDALDSETSNATATTPFPLGSYQPVSTKIHDIQGDGANSPLEGDTVGVEGIVTGDFQEGDSDTTRDLEGFFIQEEAADVDGDPDTSEGIFVYDGGFPSTDVNPGDKVRVVGQVTEFFGETQIETSAGSVTLTGTGTVLPADIVLPAASVVLNSDGEYIPDLEPYEGMFVRFSDPLYITELSQLDRYGEISLSQGGRLAQFTHDNAPQVTGYDSHLQNIAKRTLILDDGRKDQNPAPIRYPDGSLDPTDSLRLGDIVTDLTGNLRFSRGSGSNGEETYRLVPTAAPNFVMKNPRPSAPPEVGGTLKIVSFNLMNYFNGDGMGGGFPTPRGADTADEFDRQTRKLVSLLTEMDADIVAVMELENDYTDGPHSALAGLVEELNGAAGAGSYDYVDPGTLIGDDQIAVGMIYQPAKLSIAEGTSIAILDDSQLASLGMSGPVFNGANTNRSPLAVSFEEKRTGEIFTLAVNHLKSKSGAGTGANADAGDGQGSWNQHRLKGVQAIHAWLETDPTQSDDPDFLLIGDLNAYSQEDPIGYLNGRFVNLVNRVMGSDAYSYVFNRQCGLLDHAFGGLSLADKITGVKLWHINADEPDALDYDENFNPANLFNGSDPYRASDHDPLFIGLDLAGLTLPPACKEDTITVTRSDDAGPGTLRQALSDICPGGTIIIKPDVKLTSGPLTVDRNVILKADPLDYSQGNRTIRRAADAPEFPLFTVETNVSLCLEELSLTGGNSPNGPGGAVRFVGGDAQGGRLSAKRCTFYANQAQTGGAIYNLHGQVRLENCTFSGNQSLGHGGAICNGSRYGRIRMVHCTVCANLAMGRGGGIANLSGRVTLQNSLVTGNLSAQAGPDLYGEFIGDGYNLIGDTGDSHGWGETDLTGISWDQVIAPWLADNGGGVLTHALIPTGPAVNGGDPAVTVIEEAPPWFDNRGYGFLRVENGRTDIGAYEYAALPGDLDGNGVVALADAVLGLKLLAGIAVDRLNPAAELVEDGDGVIGMAEIGHILRSISRR